MKQELNCMERIVNAIHRYLDEKEKEKIKRLKLEASQLRLQQHFNKLFSEKVIGIKKDYNNLSKVMNKVESEENEN